MKIYIVGFDCAEFDEGDLLLCPEEGKWDIYKTLEEAKICVANQLKLNGAIMRILEIEV